MIIYAWQVLLKGFKMAHTMPMKSYFYKNLIIPSWVLLCIFNIYICKPGKFLFKQRHPRTFDKDKDCLKKLYCNCISSVYCLYKKMESLMNGVLILVMLIWKQNYLILVFSRLF